MDPSVVLDRFGGIASRRLLLTAGVSVERIAAEARLGMIERVRRGWYASRSASIEQLVAVRVGGRLGGLTAARSYGLWGGTGEVVEVCVPRNSARLRLSTDRTKDDRYDRPVKVIWRDVDPDHLDRSNLAGPCRGLPSAGRTRRRHA